MELHEVFIGSNIVVNLKLRNSRAILEALSLDLISSEVNIVIAKGGVDISQYAIDQFIGQVDWGIKDSRGRATFNLVSIWNIRWPVNLEAES